MGNRHAGMAAVLAAIAALTPLSPCEAAPPPTVAVTGAVAKPAVWSAEDLRRIFAGKIQDITYTLKGHPHTAKALPLYAVIEQVQPRYNPHIKNHSLQFVVEVQGRDGYTADFTIAELSPDIGGRNVWLAVEEDGAPLADESAPAEVVSPDDRKPARWVHGVVAITVVDTAQETGK